MRILSSFKDFYDFVVTEPDNKKVYVRETAKVVYDIKDVNENHVLSPKPRIELRNGNSVFTESTHSNWFVGSILFCDRVRPYIKIEDEIFWHFEDLPEKFVEARRKTNKWGYRKKKKKLTDKEFERWSWHGRFDRILHYEKIDWLVNGAGEPIKTNLNKILNVPIIMLKDSDLRNIEVNTKLNEIGFNKTITPTEAYQELYNWIPYHEPATPSSPDDMGRYEAKGFDKKTSFRPNIKE